MDSVAKERPISQEWERQYWQASLVGELARLEPGRIAALAALWPAARADLETFEQPPGFVRPFEFWEFPQPADLPADSWPPAALRLLTELERTARAFRLMAGGAVPQWARRQLFAAAVPDFVPGAFPVDLLEEARRALEITVTLTGAVVGILPNASGRGAWRQVGSVPAARPGRFAEWDTLRARASEAAARAVDELEAEFEAMHPSRRQAYELARETNCERLALVLTRRQPKRAGGDPALSRLCRLIGIDTPSQR